MKDGTTIRVPEELVSRIDELIEDGHYGSRSEFVTASVRYALIFYADIRKIALDGNSTVLGIVSSMTIPKPINDNISGFDILEKKESKEEIHKGEKTSEETISRYYSSVTQTLLKVFDLFGGKKIQIVFAYSDGLRNRARVLFRKSYGFDRKMDFIKASIIILLVKTFETNRLYDEIDRYFSEMEMYHSNVVSDLLYSFLDGKTVDKIIDGVIESMFEDIEDDADEISSTDKGN